MQMLSDTIDDIFTRFDCRELMNAEYRRRTTTLQTYNFGDRRIPSFFYSLTAKQSNGNSEIQILKYFISLNKLEEKAVITFNDRLHFGVVAQKNRVFVLGGEVNGLLTKSVSCPIHEIICNY